MIKKSVINTFNRVNIPHYRLDNKIKSVTSHNRFTGESCNTTMLIAYLIDWVYKTSNDYEQGIREVNISDFDRVRYFILEQDSNAYSVCID